MSRAAAFAVAALTFAAGSTADEADSPRISRAAAAQMQALVSIKSAKTALESKLDSRLHLALLHRRGDPRLAPLTDFRFMKPEPDGRVAVDVILASAAAVKPAVAAIESLGGVVRDQSPRYRRVSARVGLEDLEALAALPGVRRVRQAIPARTNAINVSEGDLTHGTPQARNFFGVTGAGVKIGVISDGVDSLAALQASGDLPASVEVLPGQAGSGDEGSAMLEIVHDLAPDAELAFATAVNSEASFAQNILDLAAAGCDIIVDDIIYLDESPFQDGPVAQAVNTVTSAGVLYFSSAGNEGNADDLSSGTWEGDFAANGTPPVLSGAGPAHNFGDGGQSILVQVGGGNPPLLIWAEHYDLAVGLASTDFDLYVLNGTLTTIFDASTDVQDGTGGDDFPIEFVGGGTFNGERLVVTRFAAGSTSSVPMFNLIVFRGELADALATRGATRGHSASPDAFSVAATPAAESFDGVTPDGPYPNPFTAVNESESFTSDGPRRILLASNGTEITPGNRTSTGGVVRQKPDITAADGVATAAPGFNPFYGTSAAAPHAAAIAGLIKSAVPAVTPAQVRAALVSTAIDIEAAGVDASTGAGIIMAHPALLAAGAVPQAALATGTPVPTQVLGDGDADIEPNEIWALSVPLTNNGGVAATGISAVLGTTTPGVTVFSGSSTYPDLAPAATASNDTAFTLILTGAMACDADVALTLTATYTGGPSPRALGFTLDTASTCDAPPLQASVAGTKTVSGSFLPGGTVTYTVTLANNGGLSQGDNPGDEFVDVLPAALTLVSASATSGTAVATVATNTVTWNGSLSLLGGSATITITATLDAVPGGTVVSNQGTANFDADGNGTNESTRPTDDPAVGGAADPTTFVAASVVTETAAKTVIGDLRVRGNIAYIVVITNGGNATSGDNPGDEFTDVLPASLTLFAATATSGTTVATTGTNTVTWNGSIPAGGSVTITIYAGSNFGTGGTTVSNQGTVSYDSDANGDNDASTVTDDPAVGGGTDPTDFEVAVGSYFSVAPCRIVDTRTDPPQAPIAPGATAVLLLMNACGIPPTAKAVSANVTVTQTQADGHLTIYPADAPLPSTSTLNYRAGRNRANNAILVLAGDASGTVRVRNQSSGSTHVIIDVTGFFE